MQPEHWRLCMFGGDSGGARNALGTAVGRLMCIVPGMTSRVLAGRPPVATAVRRPARPRRGRAPAQTLANLPVRRRVRPIASRPRPDRVTPAPQTGGMESPALHAPARGVTTRCAGGLAHSRSHTGAMRASRRAQDHAGEAVNQLARRAKGVPKTRPGRDSSMPGGGTTGGSQRSAPWHRWDWRFGIPVDRLGRAFGSGSTAHRSHPTLPVLLDCWTARPSWTDL
jgi:hypothetical protein